MCTDLYRRGSAGLFTNLFTSLFTCARAPLVQLRPLQRKPKKPPRVFCSLPPLSLLSLPLSSARTISQRRTAEAVDRFMLLLFQHETYPRATSKKSVLSALELDVSSMSMIKKIKISTRAPNRLRPLWPEVERTMGRVFVACALRGALRLESNEANHRRKTTKGLIRPLSQSRRAADEK